MSKTRFELFGLYMADWMVLGVYVVASGWAVSQLWLLSREMDRSVAASRRHVRDGDISIGPQSCLLRDGESCDLVVGGQRLRFTVSAPMPTPPAPETDPR